MKKILTLLLILAFLSVSSIAESIDLSAMTLEELVAFDKEIQNEISERAAPSAEENETIPLPVGLYTVGKDIAAGTYILEDIPLAGEEDDFSGWYVRVYKDESSVDEDDYRRLKLDGNSGRLILMEGEVMEIESGYGSGAYGELKISKATENLFADAPDAETVYLPIGYYSVGKDIAAGTYVIQSILTKDDDHYFGWWIEKYPNEESLYSDDYQRFEIDKNGSCLITLNDGEVMYVITGFNSRPMGELLISKASSGLFMD